MLFTRGRPKSYVQALSPGAIQIGTPLHKEAANKNAAKIYRKILLISADGLFWILAVFSSKKIILLLLPR